MKLSLSDFFVNCEGATMAEAALTDQDAFQCSVCLDSLKDPVTISCGHNYCLSCISDCWDQEDQKGVYSCPQCRETFRPRPVLRKNTMLAELVEKMQKTGIQSALSVSDPGDVECDFCTGRKLKAVKSCIVCRASMCDTHIQPHYDVPALKKHKLVSATSQLEESICSKHDKLLEVFCRTDQSCICMMCIMEEHKDHETVSAAAERAEKQKQLRDMQNQSQQKILQTVEDLQELREALPSYKKLSEESLATCERIFTDLLQCIERRRSEVKELILAQQKLEVSQAEGILKDLEQKITILRKEEAELLELSLEEDNVYFLKRFHTFKSSPVIKHSPMDTLSMSFQDLEQSLSTLRQRVEDICEADMVNISKKFLDESCAEKSPDCGVEETATSGETATLNDKLSVPTEMRRRRERTSRKESGGCRRGNREKAAGRGQQTRQEGLREKEIRMRRVNREEAAGWEPVTWEVAAGWDPVAWEEAAGWGPVTWEEAAGWGPVNWEEAAGWGPVTWEEAAGWGPVTWEEGSRRGARNQGRGSRPWPRKHKKGNWRN